MHLEMKKKWHKKYRELVIDFYDFENKVRLFDVDFTKKWWLYLFKRPAHLFYYVISRIIQVSFFTLTPIFIGYLVVNFSQINLMVYVLFSIFIRINIRLSNYVYKLMIEDLRGSVQSSAYKYFLSTDPVNHSTKSTGQIVSKLNAIGRPFLNLIRDFFKGIFEPTISYLAVSIALFNLDITIGLFSLGFFLFIVSLSCYLKLFNVSVFYPELIKKRDKWQKVNIENLRDINHIRTTFATSERYKLQIKALKKGIAMYSTYDSINDLKKMILRFIETGFFVLILYLVVNLIQNGKINPVIATSMILSFYNVINNLETINNSLSSVIDMNADVEDSFKFINNFGKQSYPVLDEKEKV